MLTINDIKVLDIETINNCNASCPLCLRAVGIKTNDVLDWTKVIDGIPQSVWDNLSDVNFNGTTGDNIMNPHIKDIILWTTNHTNALISIHTNGSIRNEDWWFELGKDLQNSNHRIVFGIDGLAGTHERYRVGTNWDKVIANATAFIKGGGNAEWQFILFDHNVNEIEECYNMSKDIGFKNFITIYQDRFDETGITQNIKRYEGDLTNFKKYGLVVKESSNHIGKFKNSCISCKSKTIGWLSIYADGTVWPCCWLMGWHKVKSKSIASQIVKKHLKDVLKIDFDSINLYSNSVEEILNSELWIKNYPISFTDNPNPVCRQQCSV
jgi:MoaA/NifB/PqqE/SkfB family radical SAM enzyme